MAHDQVFRPTLNHDAGASRQLRSRGAGFTFIEILVAIGIIALLIGIMVPVLGMVDDRADQVRVDVDKQQLQVNALASSIHPEELERVAGTAYTPPTGGASNPAPVMFTPGTSPIPQALLNLAPSAFTPWQKWSGDHRFDNLTERPVSHTFGDWFEGTGGRLFINGGTFSASGDHYGQPFKGWSEYYFKDVTFDGLQWATESNAGTKRGALINVDFHDVREDAIRDVAGHIENVTIHSARLHPGSHGDTIDWKTGVDGAYIKDLTSNTGVLNGIIIIDVKNIVIDGYVHRGEPDHLSIDIGGPAENVTIRNAKLSGGIRFRGSQTNVNIDWATVQTHVKDW